ncbi:MAG: DUF6493 family protein [Roseivirga sp.]
MSIEKEFEGIVKEGRLSKILAFLKSLSVDERKIISKEIGRYKELWEYRWDEKSVAGITYTSQSDPKGTDDQKKILTYAAFVCGSFRSFIAPWHQRQIVNLNFLEKVLPWTVPAWFDKYINELATEGWHHHFLDYFDLLKLSEKGYCHLSPETITIKLSSAIYRGTVQGYNFQPDLLLAKAVILDEHFWHLFRYEASFSWTNSGHYYLDKRKDVGWLQAIELYIAEGRIARIRLLKEAFLAGNRGFNKRASGGFMEIPLHFKPTKAELVEIEDALISTLSSPHSKVVNIALKYIKTLVNEESFGTEAFLDFVPALLTSETKSVVSSTLMILDKLARAYSELTSVLVQMSFQVFIPQDASLQLRAAKFVAKYLKEDDYDNLAELTAYEDQLMFEASEVLSPFLTSASDEVSSLLLPEVVAEEEESIDDLIPIPEINSVDELVFLASQAFDNNESYHLDQLPVALLALVNDLTIDDFKKLLPAFQRAYRLLRDDWIPKAGYLDYVLALFFLHVGRHFIEKFGGNAVLQGLTEEQQKWFAYRLPPMSHGPRQMPDIPAYAINCEKLSFVLDKMISGNSYQLLSAPTHSPAWIDPRVFIERLARAERENTELNEVDFQLAVSRCYPVCNEIDEAIQNGLIGEFRALMGFLYLGETTVPQKTKWARVWQTAILTRQSMLGNEALKHHDCFKYDIKSYLFDFHWFVEVGKKKGPGWETKKAKSVDYKYTTERVNFKKIWFVKSKIGLFQMAKALIVPHSSVSKTRPLPVSFEILASWASFEDCDMARFFGMCPNNCEYLLQALAFRIYPWSTLSGELEKNLAAEALTAMVDYKGIYSAIWSDFLGMSLLASDKTIRIIAGEVWAIHVLKPGFDNKRTGVAIARLCEEGFVPLKRFLDVASVVLTHSAVHEQRMSDLLSACIPEMTYEPVKNTKLLLTILLETRRSVNEPLGAEVLHKLEQWRKTKSLNPIINKLTKT